MATENQINDLVNAAKLKLKAQEEPLKEVQEDIYAEMREELNQENKSYKNQDYGDDNFQIKYNEEENQEYDYRINENDNPIFENGPGESQLEIWKKQFSKEKIFHVQILEKHFVFRTLNRFEYKQIVAIDNIDALHREEIICKTCVLWPYEYNFKKMASEDSGYPSTLAQIIMENSGFTKEYGIEIL